MIILTIENVPGKQVTKVLGIAKGISVQTKNMFSDMGAGFKSMVGGKLGAYENMVTNAYNASLTSLVNEAKAMGANAVIGLKFATTNTTTAGSAELVAYGTAVVVE